MIFGKGECRRTRRTSNENLTKSAKIAAFWQGSFYSCLAYHDLPCPDLPDYKRFYRFINLIRAKFYAFFVQMNKVVVADNFFLHRVNKPV